MAYQDDPEGYRMRLEAKRQPNHVRPTMAFAGLHQVTHKIIKHAVVDEVAGFCPQSRSGRFWTGRIRGNCAACGLSG